METLLIFLVIAVIQLIATYSKQKKEAAKKAAKKSAPLPPEATEPIPDPFREIRKAIGLPPAEEEEPEPEPEYVFLKEEPEHSLKEEGVAPVKNFPLQSIADKKHVEKEEHSKFNIDISKPSQGILWTAILQEPRYKRKWKPLTANR